MGNGWSARLVVSCGKRKFPAHVPCDLLTSSGLSFSKDSTLSTTCSALGTFRRSDVHQKLPLWPILELWSYIEAASTISTSGFLNVFCCSCNTLDLNTGLCVLSLPVGGLRTCHSQQQARPQMLQLCALMRSMEGQSRLCLAPLARQARV